MPQKICSVCISYLKHAIVFRQQAINNLLSLQTAKTIGDKLDVISDTPEAKTDKFFNNSYNPKVSIETFRHLKEEIDLFFEDINNDESEVDEDEDDSEDDEVVTANGTNRTGTKTENFKTAIHHFFNYSEKPFEEDDVIEDIIVKIPEDCKERKCYACSRRFMLNESYETHLKECIEVKLVEFIKDSHHLLVLRKHRAVSPQEFIRRIVFSLKNIVKSLALCYRVLISSPVQPLVESKNVTANNTKEKFLSKKTFAPIDRKIFQAANAVAVAAAGTALNEQINNISFASKPMNNNQVLPVKIPNFVAKCPLCQKTFDSLHALETHNQQHHNRDSVSSDLSEPLEDINAEKRSAWLAFLNSTDYQQEGIVHVKQLHSGSRSTRLACLNTIDYDQEGIVDVMKLRQKSPKPNKISY